MCLSLCVAVCAFVEELWRTGANAGLTTVLLLLQPKWQASVCVPIPILCSRVLESWKWVEDEDRKVKNRNARERNSKKGNPGR